MQLPPPPRVALFCFPTGNKKERKVDRTGQDSSTYFTDSMISDEGLSSGAVDEVDGVQHLMNIRERMATEAVG